MRHKSKSTTNDQIFHRRRHTLQLKRNRKREKQYAFTRRTINKKAAEDQLKHLRARQSLELLHKESMLELERDHEMEMAKLRHQPVDKKWVRMVERVLHCGKIWYKSGMVG